MTINGYLTLDDWKEILDDFLWNMDILLDPDLWNPSDLSASVLRHLDSLREDRAVLQVLRDNLNNLNDLDDWGQRDRIVILRTLDAMRQDLLSLVQILLTDPLVQTLATEVDLDVLLDLAAKEADMDMDALAQSLDLDLDNLPPISSTNKHNPTATPLNHTIDEDVSLALSRYSLGFADEDSGDTLVYVTITNLPDKGNLLLHRYPSYDEAVEAGQLISAYDISEHNLYYRPADDANATYTATFKYTVSDGSRNSAEATMTITVEADDDPATGIALANITTAIYENADTTNALKVEDIIITNPDGGSLGTLQLAGVHASMFEISGTELRLKAGVSLDHETVPMLMVRVQLAEDNTIGADYTLPVNDANDAPTATAAVLDAISEDAIHIFTATHFGFMDADTGDTLQSVTIVSLPTAGMLTLNGAAVRAGQSMAASDIANLVYYPGDTFAADGTATFTYTVSDGTDSSTPTTMTIAVEADDDPATGMALANAITSLRAHSNTSSAFMIANIDITDADGGAFGTLELAGTNADMFQIADASSGNGKVLRLNAGQTLTEGDVLQVRVQLAGDSRIRVDHSLTITENMAPSLEVDKNIAFNEGENFILTWRQLNANDPEDTTAVNLIYTLTGITGGVLEREVSEDVWTTLTSDGSATFTQAEIESGTIRLNPTGEGSFTVTLTDEVEREGTISGTINFRQRIAEKAMGVEVGGADINRSDDPAPRTIITGFGETTITPGTGDDEVDPGLGDDVVDLRAGGDDIVMYRYGTSGGTTIAWGGGDRIMGFTPGKDQVHLAPMGGASGDFLDGLGRGFTVTLSTEYTGREDGGGDRANLDYYKVTGIEIHFSQAMLMPGGVLGGSILTIEFAAPIAWADEGTPGGDGYVPGFKTTWLSDGGFSTRTLLFIGNDAGRAALERILGLGEVEGADDPRSVAVGNDSDNVIDIANDVSEADQAGEWVVFGGGGNDEITLGAGTEDVVYRLGVDEANGNAITAPEGSDAATDGSDVVSKFTLGTDRLTFVDTEGTLATLADLLGAFRLVSLAPDGDDTHYTGIAFDITESVTLRINFAMPMVKEDLTGDPATLSPDTVSTDGIALINELFGADNISVVDTLPAELL